VPAFDDDFVPRSGMASVGSRRSIAQWLDTSGITRSAAIEVAIERTLPLPLSAWRCWPVSADACHWPADLVQAGVGSGWSY